jgi:hypothetical protein
LNALFAEPPIEREQRAGAAALDAHGVARDDERW